jgi:hypothetical protein
MFESFRDPPPAPKPRPQNSRQPAAGPRQHLLLPDTQPTWNLRLESTGSRVAARFLIETPNAAALVVEDLCWQAATEDWKNHRPHWWHPQARAAWQAEGDELAAEAAALRQMADGVFREL